MLSEDMHVVKFGVGNEHQYDCATDLYSSIKKKKLKYESLL